MKKASLFLVVAVAMLGACSKQTPSADAAASQSQAEVAEQAKPELAKAEPSTPESAFKRIEDPFQLTAYASVLSGMPADYSALAEKISRDYWLEKDGFKKKDMENALKPRIDALLADAKGRRYFIFELPVSLREYDFAAKSFGTGFNNDSYFTYSGDAQQETFAFSNTNAVSSLIVSDEEVARVIEKLRTNYESDDLVLSIYAFAQGTDLSNNRLKAQVVKVKLLNEKGETLVEQKAI